MGRVRASALAWAHVAAPLAQVGARHCGLGAAGRGGGAGQPGQQAGAGQQDRPLTQLVKGQLITTGQSIATLLAEAARSPTAPSARLKMATGMARSLVGWFVGLRAIT